MFTFTPKTDEELDLGLLLVPGVYDFEVIHAIEKLSKAGNQMVEVNLKIYKEDGSCAFVYDYLMEAMAFKIKHFCKAIGLLEKYNQGSLDANEFIGKCAKAKILIKKDTTGTYKDKNIVQDYIVSEVPVIKREVNTETFGDDIPF